VGRGIAIGKAKKDFGDDLTEETYRTEVSASFELSEVCIGP